MANKYWRGGTANWDGTATGKWSLDPATFVQATLPGAGDAVFFDATSTGTVTIAAGNGGAGSINCTGFTGTIAGSAAISVAGSITLAAGMANYTHTGTVTITGTGTLTTAGKSFSALNVNGAGITVTLGDSLNLAARGLTITAGTFDTSASGFAVSAGTLSSSNANTRAITLNASILNLSGTVTLTTTTGLTFNAGSSQINLSANTGTFNGGGLTFNNVAFTSTTPNSTGWTVSGVNTFANITIDPKASAGLNPFMFSAAQTISGTLTVNSGNTDAARRFFLESTTLGTQRNLTIGTLSAVDCDFQDINLLGTASGSSPTRAGDCKGNSNITFPAAKNVYWNGAGGAWSNNVWATSSGGSPAVANFPLAQDTAIIEATGLSSGSTVTINDNWNIGSIDLSARTANTVTLASGTTTPTYYGDYKLGSGVTISGTGSTSFSGRVTQNITSAGVQITFPVSVNLAGTSFRLLDNLTTNNAFNHNSGTLDVNSLALSCLTYFSPNATRTMAFGSTGTITVTSTATATIWNTAFGANLTVTGTPNVIIASTSSNNPTIVMGGNSEAASLSFTFNGGSYTPVLSANANYRNLTFLSAFSGTVPNVTMGIWGDLTIGANTNFASGTNVVSFLSTSATPRDITTNGKFFDSPVTFNGTGGTWRLIDDLTMGATRTLTHTNGTINLNGKTLTIGATGSYATASGTKNITFNGGVLNVTAQGGSAFNNTAAGATGFTTTAGTGTGEIRMTSASAKTFVGGGRTYNCTLTNNGAGTLTITGSNTFATIANGVVPATFTFTSGTTTTISSAWNINGTSGLGNLVVINSSVAGSRHFLSKSSLSGNVSADYLNITDSDAAGGAIWNAGFNSTDGGNNSGWVFSGAISASASDSITFSDLTSATGTFGVSSSDTFTITDAATFTLTFSDSASDTITFTDLTDALLPILASASDSIAFTDLTSSQATITGSSSDSIVLVDFSESTGTFTVTLADSLSFTDTDSASISMSFSLSDSFTLSDATSLQLALLGECSDSLVFADVLSSTANLSLALQDDIAFLDLTQNIASLLASASDTITFSDVPNLYSLGWTPISSGVANPWSQISSGASNPWSPISSGAANPWTPIT